MATTHLDNVNILKNFYKSVSSDMFIEPPKENEIIKRYKFIQKNENPQELILDITYNKKKITFITGDFRKFTIPFSFIKGWGALNEKDKYSIQFYYAEIIFGDDKLFFPFEEVLYAKDKKYKKKVDKENAPARKKLGKRIRDLRVKHGKKQRDIKGISEREVSRIENGHVWPSFKTQRKIADSLGIKFMEFLDEVHF